MSGTGSTVLDRLIEATNDHDAAAMMECLHEDYRSEQPLHPEAGFSGRDQVGKNWSFMFETVPDLRFDVVRSTLAGDLALLNRFYEVALQGDERSWRLLLKPNDPKMQEVMSEIRIGGHGNWINAIEFLEPGGDRSVMSITRDEP